MTTLAADLYLLLAAYGLAVAVSYAGLPLVCQGAFMSVGAFGTLQLAGHGVPLGVAAMTATVMAAVAGTVLGVGGARLDGAPLALGSWGLAWLIQAVLLGFPGLSGGEQGLTRAAPGRLVSRTLGVTVVLHPWVHVLGCAIACLVAAGALWRASRGPWGLDVIAMRSGAERADGLGVPVLRRRLAVFAVAAGAGALAGAGTAVLNGVAAPADHSPLLSVQLFVAVIVGGVARWWGPVVGVAVLAALNPIADALAAGTGTDQFRLRAVVSAGLLSAAVVLRAPVSRIVGGLLDRPDRVPAAPGAAVPTLRPVAASKLLAARSVSASYGERTVLTDVALQVKAGEVHALIGPNGSGKSTLLRVLAGVLPPDSGVVSLDGRALPTTRWAAPRVRAGVARTEQLPPTPGSLTCGEQVAVGARSTDARHWATLRHLVAAPSSRSVESRRRSSVDAALAVVGLPGHAPTPLAAAAAGDQRLVQLATVAATGAGILLLDEPAAGMSAADRARLATALDALTTAGRGVLLVEHDMALVSRVADRVTVLVAGEVLATGSPRDIRANAAVREAYLGVAPTATRARSSR